MDRRYRQKGKHLRWGRHAPALSAQIAGFASRGEAQHVAYLMMLRFFKARAWAVFVCTYFSWVYCGELQATHPHR